MAEISGNDLMKWYVVRVLSSKEKKVKEYLDAALKRDETLGMELAQVLVPMEKVYSIRNGKKVVKDKCLYPGYVMIEAVLSAKVVSVLKETPGIMAGGQPGELQADEVNRILGKVDAMSTTGAGVEVSFKVGENVVVTDGPFASFSGVVEEVIDERKKLKVIVKILGRRTPLELSYFQVKSES